MSEAAGGPWVVVVGMHRSGTSAVTTAVGALGFNLVHPEDRLSPHESNPEHGESLSVLKHNDAILAHFGGTWDAPPRLPEGWESDQGLPGRRAASELLATAYPHAGPSVFKDPRLCLLLPYWRQVLGVPVAVVFVWRPPLAVARSLRRRDGSPIPYGVALWERYNRSAVANLAQADVYVLDYEAMVEDPATVLSGLTSWLGSIGTFDGMGPLDHQRAVSVVAADLRHESAKAMDDGHSVVLEEQYRLVEYLSGLAGGHAALPQLTTDESPWTEAIFDGRRSSNAMELRKLQRQLEDSERDREWLATSLQQAGSQLDGLKSSSSWRITAPVRSVLALLASRGRRSKG